jgi:hypothetical protein
MTYRSTGICRDGDDLAVDGELALHGITRQVPLAVELAGSRHGPLQRHPDRLVRHHEDQPQGTAALQVLAGVGSRVDSPTGVGVLAGDQSADVDDPLALLTRDARPVVRIGGVG